MALSSSAKVLLIFFSAASAVRQLKLQLLQQHVFDTVKSDFLDIDSSALSIMLSDGAQENSGLSPMSILTSLASVKPAHVRIVEENTADGFFWPPDTDIYSFEVPSTEKFDFLNRWRQSQF